MDDGASAWSLPELEPTNLVALWPDDRAPTVTEIMRALELRDPEAEYSHGCRARLEAGSIQHLPQ